jgi:hypothetical protein
VANWAVSSVTFPLLVPFLRYDAYRDGVLTGLVTSASGSQSLVHDASTKAITPHTHTHTHTHMHTHTHARTHNLTYVDQVTR